MKYLPIAAATLMAASFLQAAPQRISSIAAVVNGTIITTREVATFLAPTANVLRTKYPRQGEQFRKALIEARDKVLEQLIEEKLVLSKLDELNASLPDQVVDEEVNRIIREAFDGKEADFREYLRKAGMDRRKFWQSQKEKILVQIFKQQQFKDVAPATESEIEAHYKKHSKELRDRNQDQITFRKIYIPARDSDNPAATPEDQLALAERLASELQKGEDFAEMAKAHSAGAYSDSGGLSEDTPRDELEAEFADILLDTPEGKIVGPLKGRKGFIIAVVISKKLGPAPALDKELRLKMRREVEIEKQSERYEEWIKILKRSADIKRKI